MRGVRQEPGALLYLLQLPALQAASSAVVRGARDLPKRRNCGNSPPFFRSLSIVWHPDASWIDAGTCPSSFSSTVKQKEQPGTMEKPEQAPRSHSGPRAAVVPVSFLLSRVASPCGTAKPRLHTWGPFLCPLQELWKVRVEPAPRHGASAGRTPRLSL
ncbi:hypothetical protein PAL_GLEAN10011560 [Pteropus alecto]|uniref:Secreted protein n=1 Tax=Pteropus alecto TaxID=9402 RepID=L5KG52_PTEAL|nr:hypothetical protein PAL_GLEAN10011560 [Pteropus alecto]